MIRGPRHRKLNPELRGSTWSFRVTIQEFDAATGAVVRRRRRITLGETPEVRTKAQASDLAVAFLAGSVTRELQRGPRVTLGQYAPQFLEVQGALMRESSRRQYAAVLRSHVLPALGPLLLSAIDASRVQLLILQKHRKGSARATLKNIRSITLQVLRQAHRDGFESHRISAKDVRLPSQSAVVHEPRYFAADDIDRILAATTGEWHALYAVLAYLGLRISEALGLRWRDVDMAAGIVRIRQGAVLGKVQDLKTPTSRADLPLPSVLASILADYRAAWPPNPHDLLFATQAGRPRRADTVRSDRFAPLLKRLGITPAGFHAFRHSLPRTLLAAGVSPAVVQRLLRHADLTMTTRYSHASADDLRAAVEAGMERKRSLQNPAGAPQVGPATHGTAGKQGI